MQITTTQVPQGMVFVMRRCEIVDCHSHSCFSDGVSSLEENARAAARLGITTLCCTDHWGRPDFIDCSIDASMLSVYAQQIHEVREAYPQVEIIHGLEADWYEGCAQDILSSKGEATFLLGAVHYLKELPIDWDQDVRIWEDFGADALWEHYVSTWCRAAQSTLFDSMAHPDLPRKMASQGYIPKRRLDSFWPSMAEAARAGGVCIEVNTAGLHLPIADFYPQRELLEQFYAAGVPVTVGSDAHRCEDLGADIQRAYEYCASVGYRSINVPSADGGWRTLSIA